MPFYTGDYLKDTMHLTTQEHGAYLLLILHYWNSQKPLPGDDKKLAAISHLPLDEWLECKQTILDFFYLDEDVYKHRRIEKELNLKEERSAAGKLGNKIRWQNDRKTIAKRSQTASQNDPNHIHNSQSHTQLQSYSKRKVFKPPSIEEIKGYCLERKNEIDAEQFYDFYESKGWMVGKEKMKDWKASIRTWEKRETKEKGKLPWQI